MLPTGIAMVLGGNKLLLRTCCSGRPSNHWLTVIMQTIFRTPIRLSVAYRF